MNAENVTRISDCVWEIPKSGNMLVPVRLIASETLLARAFADKAPAQAVNVACLPGIRTASMAMPDMHWGYGFPIGGVAAFDIRDGVVSPGGVGYDINCGVRLMAVSLTRNDLGPRLHELLTALYQTVPAGVGAAVEKSTTLPELQRVAKRGAGWAVARGAGEDADLAAIEEQGCMSGAEPRHVSPHAWERGQAQLGTLGSGNHFLELAIVDEIYDAPAAGVMGLAVGQVTVSIHCGSRGFGHQVCDDYLAVMERVAAKYGIAPPDRQLACAPIGSPEGQAYLGAMRCAVNFAFANRQLIADGVRRCVRQVFGATVHVRTVYEVAHNIAKLEHHVVDGERALLCVHRKGATRAFGPGHPDVPAAYAAIGQPVLVPGDMGRCSYVLVGTARAMEVTFGSACHGAGRAMSRHAALKSARGRNIAEELRRRGIEVMAEDRRTLAEEMPEAYKNVSQVVDACERAGIARRVARLVPIGCIKG